MAQVTLLCLPAVVARRTRLILNTAFSDDLARTSVCAGRPSLQSGFKCSLFLVCYISREQNYVDTLTRQIIFFEEKKKTSKHRSYISSSSDIQLILSHHAGEAWYCSKVLNEAVPRRHLVERSLLQWDAPDVKFMLIKIRQPTESHPSMVHSI